MTAKEELNQYKYMRQRADETLEEYEKYKARAEKMTSSLSNNLGRTNTIGDKVGNNASIMADIEKKYKQRWLDAEYKKLEIEKSIDCVEEPYRTILHMKYIDGMELFEIAAKLNYKSYTYCCEQHGTALKKYEKNRIKPN